jgi:iron complex outermembrane receptor protein
VDVLSAPEFKSLVEKRYEGQDNVLKLLGNSNTDWQSEIFQDAFGMDHSISFLGSTKFMPYRVSLGYTNQDGILKTDNMKRTTIAASLTPSFFDDNLKVTLNVKGTLLKINLPTTAPLVPRYSLTPPSP